MKMRALSMLLALTLVCCAVIPAGSLTANASDTTPANGIAYEDVPEGAWFYDAIAYMTANGYMIGMSETHFRPEGVLTRGQFVTILHRLEGAPDIVYSDRFSDVPENQWYTNAILWAEENGIVKGYNDNTFGVTDLITREQMVVMMHRFASDYKGLNLEGNTELSEFSDSAQVSGYALEAIGWAVFNGLIQGSADPTGVKLLPSASANRAQCAAIIQRFMEKLEHIDATDPKEDELPMIPVV